MKITSIGGLSADGLDGTGQGGAQAVKKDGNEEHSLAGIPLLFDSSQ